MIKHDFELAKLTTLAFLKGLDPLSVKEKQQQIYNKLQELNFHLMKKFTFGKFKDNTSYFKYTLMTYAVSLK